MKKILISLLLLASVAGFSQKKEKRNHRDFTKVAFSVPGNAYVRQGSSWFVEIEADEDVIDRVETVVEGSRLVIRVKPTLKGLWNWDSADKVIARITLPEPEAITVNGSGDLKGEGRFKTGNMSVNVNGSGSAELELESGNVDLSVSGSGEISVKGRMKDLESSVSGSGKIYIDAESSGAFSGDISGSGKINIQGKAQSADLVISGSGQVHGYGLSVARCNARISGSGDIEITASTDLDATISGNGTVTYKGNPKHVNSHSSGSGKVRHEVD